jgi:hypothetical protein
MRSNFIAIFSLLACTSLLCAEQFNLSIHGDLDDDLFVIKSTPQQARILDALQMHNPKDVFFYKGESYKSEMIFGTIEFDKTYLTDKDSLHLVMLANEREEASANLLSLGAPSARTHYKSEALKLNSSVLLPALMPEYNSLPAYPLWFNDDEHGGSCFSQNNDEYNYYNLWENAVVQIGIIFPAEGRATVRLFDNEGNLIFSYNEDITVSPKALISEEVKKGKVSKHLMLEPSGVIHSYAAKPNTQMQSPLYISSMLIEYAHKSYAVEMPFAFMYPNRIFGAALHEK